MPEEGKKGLSAAERQRRHREKLRREGVVPVKGKILGELAERLQAQAELRGLSRTELIGRVLSEYAMNLPVPGAAEKSAA